MIGKCAVAIGALTVLVNSPVLFSTPEEDCKTSAQLGVTPGDLLCDIQINCSETGATCEKTKWHKNVQDPWIYFCNCGTSDQYSGPDPTKGLCMAYVATTSSGAYVNRCSSGNCTLPQTCKQEAVGAYKKCICRN